VLIHRIEGTTWHREIHTERKLYFEDSGWQGSILILDRRLPESSMRKVMSQELPDSAAFKTDSLLPDSKARNTPKQLEMASDTSSPGLPVSAALLIAHSNPQKKPLDCIWGSYTDNELCLPHRSGRT
jgi:hypothetical protein